MKLIQAFLDIGSVGLSAVAERERDRGGSAAVYSNRKRIGAIGKASWHVDRGLEQASANTVYSQRVDRYLADLDCDFIRPQCGVCTLGWVDEGEREVVAGEYWTIRIDQELVCAFDLLDAGIGPSERNQDAVHCFPFNRELEQCPAGIECRRDLQKNAAIASTENRYRRIVERCADFGVCAAKPAHENYRV